MTIKAKYLFKKIDFDFVGKKRNETKRDFTLL
jgi:hypothetical protein